MSELAEAQRSFPGDGSESHQEDDDDDDEMHAGGVREAAHREACVLRNRRDRDDWTWVLGSHRSAPDVPTRLWRGLDVLSASGRRGGATKWTEWWPNLLPRRRWAIHDIAQASQTWSFADGLSLVPGERMSNEKACGDAAL